MIEHCQGQIPARKLVGSTGLLTCVIMVIGLVTAPAGHAVDLDQCMIQKMRQSDDGTTIGELRTQCREQLEDQAGQVKAKEPAVVSERILKDSEHVLQPYTLMSHKPNYILLAAYNSSGYDPSLYREQFNDPSINFEDTEAQFQISVKTPLAIDVFDTFDIYAAYTNRSFWQMYNSDTSKPFRETNHEPEIWAQFESDLEFFGFNNTVNTLGFVHQSNGRGGVLSRSWNRIFANVIVEKGNLALSFKPWYRIPEDDDDDDNPDITDYLGHYELRAAYKWGDHVFSGMSRNNLESGFSKGAVELGWSFPLGNYPYLKGYVQFFNGYGESLIDYNKYTNRIGIGFSLTDWL